METDAVARPGPHRGSPQSRGAAVLWLTAATLVLLALPLFALFASLRADVARLQAAVVEAQVAAASPAPAEDLATLRAAAASGLTTEASVQAALAGRTGVAWVAVLERIVPPAPAKVSLTGLQQRGCDLAIHGQAIDEPALLTYLARLQGSPLFEAVQLQSTAGAGGTIIAFSVAVRLRGYTP
jgi:Tfp pilus assembly protein PilN